MAVPTLRTARLVLRPFHPDDAPRLATLLGDEAVADTLAETPHPYPPGQAEQWIASQRERAEAGGVVSFAIVVRDGDALVGGLSLHLTRRHDRARLEVWIGRAYWNAGLATEAATAAVDHGFRRLNLHRIEARHVARQRAAARVAEKLGMAYEGTLRRRIRRWNAYEDEVCRAILAAEWADG